MRDATTITAEIVASGITPAQTMLLMELVLSLSTGSSGRNPVESPEYRALENRRAWDRERQARKRAEKKTAKLVSAKSTGHPPDSTGLSGGNADHDTVVLEDKQDGLSVKERKKGSRLLSDARVSDDDRRFAIENNIPENRVDAEWTEFVDYWIGVPGSRGVKLDWSATWRNRVRDTLKRGHRNANGPGAGSNPASNQSGSTAIIAGVAAATERRARERHAAGQQRPAPGDDDPAKRDDPELFGAR